MLNPQRIYHPDPLDQFLATWIILAQLVIWLMSAWQLLVVNKRQTCDIQGAVWAVLGKLVKCERQ